eukprot:TRINITY_DN94823_c0_g1_i1.p1 TRINITY_DN94823_c0_g1~~TRINITY_DN94823_c0_g1_i1.p1  ORF type:complete len:316 (-),score=58.93 TRINITY_DN94823_c0_g1_i1:238-1185(-)
MPFRGDPLGMPAPTMASRRSTKVLALAAVLLLLPMTSTFARTSLELPLSPALTAKPSMLTGSSLVKSTTQPTTCRQLFQGTVLDPSYWKRQWFLSGDLRKQMPKNIERLCVLEFLPTDNKYLAYCVPQGERRINRYIALWEGDDDLKKNLLETSGIYSEKDPEFVDWIAGKQTQVEKEVADVVIVPAGAVTSLGNNLERGLQEMWRILKPEGRALIVLDSSESSLLGDLDAVLDGILASQPQDDLLSATGLDLRSIVNDEENSGLTLAVCFKNVKATSVAARRTAGAAKKQRRTSSVTARRDGNKQKQKQAKRRR